MVDVSRETKVESMKRNKKGKKRTQKDMEEQQEVQGE